jgi:plasmid stabilization system protein ParE
MKYRVHLTENAELDAEEAYNWISERAPQAAVKWFNGLFQVIDSLETFPKRCGVAPESAKTPEETRQFLYGRRPHLYRLLFIIRSDDVYVLHVRHGARREMKPEEIKYPA